MAKQFTLGKDERLKSRKLIEQLFKEGKSFVVAPFRIYWIANENKEIASLQFGAGVSTKNFKKAVDRNRIKRLTREAWRLQKNPLQERLQQNDKRVSVFFIYTAKELPLYEEVYKKVATSINKLDKLIS